MKIFISLCLALLFSACSFLQTTKPQTPQKTPSYTGSTITSTPTKKPETIAIIVPEKVIRSYSNIVTNAALAYVLRQEAKLEVQIFLIGTEDEANLKRALDEIRAKQIKLVVAALTLKGAKWLENKAESDISFYIPTLHKNNAHIRKDNFYFGGIDYEAQIKALIERSNHKFASFYDDTALSNNLNQIVVNLTNAKTYRVAGKKLNYDSLLYSKGGLYNSSIFLNTSLAKTAIISSQLRVNDIKPYVLLSTQIGYNPTLLSLTQSGDRKNMLIANSINNKDISLSYLNEIFEQSIDYNWVAYSTSIGVEFFYKNFIDKEAKTLFDEKMQDHQVIYDVRLMKALEFGFEEAGY